MILQTVGPLWRRLYFVPELRLIKIKIIKLCAISATSFTLYEIFINFLKRRNFLNGGDWADFFLFTPDYALEEIFGSVKFRKNQMFISNFKSISVIQNVVPFFSFFGGVGVCGWVFIPDLEAIWLRV